ncbi:MAG TPA: type II CAAX endopeptidase family protein [Candidatus Omnitrophota bacterium]|nr:type II CAAX endopeptidase family protein [Candidatus Omnitrophota bacterium]
MKISIKEWIVFVLVAIIALGIWYKVSYPQFTFVDLKIGRTQAFKIAKEFLAKQGVDTNSYLKSKMFFQDNWADRYLQRALGFKRQEQFVKDNAYELFSWGIRLFRENQKEEYVVEVSSRTGEVISFVHPIKETEARKTQDSETSRSIAREFLKNQFNINFNEYDFHEEQTKKFDNRTDYAFSWEKKGIYIPWDKSEDAGGAKLLIGATVSGEEVKDFYKSKLDIPEKFKRFVRNQMISGSSMFSVINFLYLGWVAWAIFILIRRKKELIFQKSYRNFVAIGIVILILSIIDGLNNFERLLFVYPTSSFLAPFISLGIINNILNYIFLTTAIIATGLAGESLRYEALPKNKFSSFFYYINSTIWSRSVAKLILLGYLVFLILLGLQSGVIYLGQKFVGVWVENIRLAKLSSSYIPYLSAFIIGITASFSEEIIYRMFGISWGRRYLKNIIIAVIFASLVWGFSHTQYAVFPFWYRGLEVSILGVFLSFIFLRYGIIPVLVAHFLFDVFWGVAGYILGNSTANLFLWSVFIMIIPLVVAAICFGLNREEKQKSLEISLGEAQKYNLDILVAFLNEKKKSGISLDTVKGELIAYGWDQILVELAIKQVYKS